MPFNIRTWKPGLVKFDAEITPTAFYGHDGHDIVDYRAATRLYVIPLTDMRSLSSQDFRVAKLLAGKSSIDLLFSIEEILGWARPTPVATTAGPVAGDSGKNTLFGTDGNDLIVGGRGNDSLKGNSGHDTFLYNLGDGNDSIVDASGGSTDTLRFGTGITPAMVTFSRGPEDDTVVVKVAGGGTIALAAQNTRPAIDLIEFSDAKQTVWEMNRILVPIVANPNGGKLYGTKDKDDGNSGSLVSDSATGSDKNDQMSLNNGNNTARGGKGDDQIVGGVDSDFFDGGDGWDILNGKAGTNYLIGGEGRDTFVFVQSGDNDFPTFTTIADYNPAEDVLSFSNRREYTAIETDRGTLLTFDAKQPTQLLLEHYYDLI